MARRVLTIAKIHAVQSQIEDAQLEAEALSDCFGDREQMPAFAQKKFDALTAKMAELKSSISYME